MEEQQTIISKQKFVWTQKFTLVLIVNAIYVALFYLLMKRFV
ncbi:hypothetical protein OAD14_05260 [Flavobacteriaceae bacterium]|nr:hypothetical protein [Flavobacteriaceae bacterium]